MPLVFLSKFFKLLLDMWLTLCLSRRKRSSNERCSIKKAVLKNFRLFTGKNLCWSDSKTGAFL